MFLTSEFFKSRPVDWGLCLASCSHSKKRRTRGAEVNGGHREQVHRREGWCTLNTSRTFPAVHLFAVTTIHLCTTRSSFFGM
jgi:hypothetical protein